MRKKASKAINVSMERFKFGFDILNRWLYVKQNGGSLSSYFKDNRVGSVAIYGMGELGKRLLEEMQACKIPVKYAIDRMADAKGMAGLDIYDSSADRFPETDAIVVTPVQDYWDIVGLLEPKTGAAIISLKDVVEYCADCLQR